MKCVVNTARILVGILFIFSGLIKANDPLGLSYKMQEFFEVWAVDPSLTTFMNWLSNYALPFSILMITLEIIVGVGILLGIWQKFFSTLLLLLIIFFGFLTGYAVLSGKIAACGCFGDCIPLTALQSFIKDIVLFILILFIFFGRNYISPLLPKVLSYFILLISVIAVLVLQWYVLRHMPFADCLPYKKGNNIIELRKMPADATLDKKEYRFFYSKDGKEKEVTANNLPDSTWQFLRREDVIIERGKNNEPPVKDFYLTTIDGTDTTDAILNTSGKYYLFYVKNIAAGTDYWLNNFTSIYTFAKKVNAPLFIITPQAPKAQQFFNVRNNYDLTILSLDATAFKTAARTNPELYLMSGPVVINKWGWADLKKAVSKNH